MWIKEVVEVEVGEDVLRRRSNFKGEDEVFVGPVQFKLADNPESFWSKLVVISGGRPPRTA